MAFMVGSVDFGDAKNYKTLLESTTPTELTGLMKQYGVSAADMTKGYNTAYGQNINEGQASQYLYKDVPKEDVTPKSIDWTKQLEDPAILKTFSDAGKKTSDFNNLLNTATADGTKYINSGNPIDPLTGGPKTKIDADGNPIIDNSGSDGTGGGTGDGPPKTVWNSILDGINAIITGGTFDQSKWMDKYNTSLENYSTDVDSWVTAAKDANASGARGQMSQTAQDVLNEMNAKGMLSSSVTGDTMSKGMSNIASQAGQQDMLAEMKGAEMKGQIPGMLGQGIQTQAALNTAALAPWKAILDLVEVWGPKYAKDL